MTTTGIDAVVADILATPWPEDIAEARAFYDRDGPRIAADIDVAPLEIAGCRAQGLVPPAVDEGFATLFLHGGGYVYGSLESHGGMAAELARAARCTVYQLDYRLAPEHPYPAALEDACAAYRWLRQKGYGADAIALAGDSAGGGLVMATLLALRDAGDALPAAAVCISPWVDLTGTGESWQSRQALDPMIDKPLVDKLARLYAGGASLTDPLISPIHGDFTGLPPLLIQVGEREVLFSEAETLAARAGAAGVAVAFEEWPGMIHVWHLYHPRLKEGRDAIDRVGAFIIENTRGGRAARRSIRA